MIAASLPVQRPADAKLLVAGARGELRHLPRRAFVELLRRGDLVVANDAATLPASLTGRHLASGASIEVRLAGARSLDRARPPPLASGDRLELDQATATVEKLLDHPRLVELRFEGSSETVWAAIAHHGRPIQYAHVPASLALWDVWTPIAAAPVAFEPPSAGFTLDWGSLAAMRERGAGFATLTLAAGISSTGDAALDTRLPFDEPYRIPEATVRAIQRTKSRGGRVIAIGTTVVRALESAVASGRRLRAGDGLATLRLGAGTRLHIVDAILSGTHAPRTSHYEMLRAFADDARLQGMSAELERCGYRTHEFGDSVLLEAASPEAPQWIRTGIAQLRGVI